MARSALWLWANPPKPPLTPTLISGKPRNTMSATKVKVADRQTICKKLVADLKKKYSGTVPKEQKDVLQGLLRAICVEGTTEDNATKTLDALTSSFCNLNEIRVSSLTELVPCFAGPEPDFRAGRFRDVLQAVFEERYAFDMEHLRKKTVEQLEKYLKQISSLTPFVCNTALAEIVHAHTVPLDHRMASALNWLGVVDTGPDEQAAAEQLKPVLRKAEVAPFCAVVREFAVDETYSDILSDEHDPGEEPTVFDVPARLKLLFAGKAIKKKKKKPAPVKEPAVAVAEPAGKEGAGKSAAKGASPGKPPIPAKGTGKPGESKSADPQGAADKKSADKKPVVAEKAGLTTKPGQTAKPGSAVSGGTNKSTAEKAGQSPAKGAPVAAKKSGTEKQGTEKQGTEKSVDSVNKKSGSEKKSNPEQDAPAGKKGDAARKTDTAKAIPAKKLTAKGTAGKPAAPVKGHTEKHHAGKNHAGKNHAAKATGDKSAAGDKQMPRKTTPPAAAKKVEPKKTDPKQSSARSKSKK